MHLEWILLNPAGPYAALAVGLSLCLFLFFTLKRDLRSAEARSRNKLSTLESGLEERLEELSRISGLLVAPEPPRSGLNLTKRSQALQMHRRGAATEEIAATLSLPRNEIELLVKVQQIVLSSTQAPAARTVGMN